MIAVPALPRDGARRSADARMEEAEGLAEAIGINVVGSRAFRVRSVRPATLLGVDKTHGSLEAGKSASFVVFDGDPFDASSRLRQVYVEGKLVHDN